MHRCLLFLAVCALAGLWTVGCADRPEWTPYREIDDRTVVLDGEAIQVSDQTEEVGTQRSQGCIDCHKGVGDPHLNISHFLSCVDCHGGNGLAKEKEDAHPKARHPKAWPTSANPVSSYTILNHEDRAWIRFVNPGDLRVANEACGGCHQEEVLNVMKSIMTNVAHFWGAAAYCNGVAFMKHSVFGESYSPEGIPQRVNAVPPPTADETKYKSILPLTLPLPRFENMQPGNILRVFEKGSRLPNPLIGIPDKLEDPGRPNNRLSDRGLGTQLRIDFPLLNLHKTRLNDPHLSFLGTNDQAGDYRSSGCTACHMIYANDRDPVHSGPYAKFGNHGQTDPKNPDPNIPKGEPGHPIEHKFTAGVPSSTCMTCHMHQPNSFVNSYYGFTMWTYEADGDVPGPDGKALWPKKQKRPTHAERIASYNHNPEGAAPFGNWTDHDYLQESAPELNKNAKHTQFADYHGHGWMMRGVFSKDREGNLLDKDGKVIPYDTPDKFDGSVVIEGKDKKECSDQRKAVHMKDIHAEMGMHCADCHFKEDCHGTGKIYGEYQAAVHIMCKDCHGTVDAYATTLTQLSGPAANESSRTLGEVKIAGIGPRFFMKGGRLHQRSSLDKEKVWPIKQVRDSIQKTLADGSANPAYNEKAAYAKTMLTDGKTWGDPKPGCDYAHSGQKMNCYTCHTSWITSCFGCHLPQMANIKVKVKHFEGDVLRQMATYNPQVVRDSEFMLGVAGTVKDHVDEKGNRSKKIAPVRSSSAVMISAIDAKRRVTYMQQPTLSAPGYSSQAFNTHFPHTVRKTETRTCTDCHLSDAGDNNAWMAQVLLLGTNSVGFMGHFTYVGQGDHGLVAVKVTEWEEPQAVIGSNLHQMAYPDDYGVHKKRGLKLDEGHHHGSEGTRALEHRGEYLYAANGTGGFRVYDVANVANKDFSERITSSPVSPLGQDTHVATTFATDVALAFNNPLSMTRTHRPENQEQWPIHPIYRYAYITDRHEGLILVDIECLTDGDPQNNFLKRAATFNPGGILAGATCLTVAGATVYVGCDRGIVVISIADPLNPRVVATVGGTDVVKPTSVTVQFRYAFVSDQDGLKVLDVTWPEKAHKVAGLPIADARNVYVAKTYAYVSAGADGLVVVDVTRPLEPTRYMTWNDDGHVNDLNMVKVATSYDSTFAYLADGKNGMHVVQIVAPNDDQKRSPFGWSPKPYPVRVASYHTEGPAVALSKALDRDRAVDESGNQVAVFARIGGRPMTLKEMRHLYMKDGQVWTVSDTPKNPGSK